jgi:hypothetical protein
MCRTISSIFDRETPCPSSTHEPIQLNSMIPACTMGRVFEFAIATFAMKSDSPPASIEVWNDDDGGVGTKKLCCQRQGVVWPESWC